MAGELSIRTEIDYEDEEVSIPARHPATSIDIAGRKLHQTQIIAEAQTAIDFGNLASARVVYFRNLNPDWKITLRKITANASSNFAIVKPGGEPCGPFCP